MRMLFKKQKPFTVWILASLILRPKQITRCSFVTLKIVIDVENINLMFISNV